jgi:ABC-type transport system involved in multi-copper enzyme maturation permease subunit
MIRAIYHIARADFLERVRRYSFLVMLLFAVYLGYGAATGKIALRLGDYRGVYTSAWIGTNMAMVASCFISLVGFYVVKNAIDRDRATRVGEILAAAPLTRAVYLLGKWLSNAAVLGVQVGLLGLASIIMQFVVAEDPHVDFWALLSPFLLMALPAMAVTGALAVLFESALILRGGIGNVVWIFTWSFVVVLPVITGLEWLDFTGLFAVMASITRAASAAIQGYNGEFGLQLEVGRKTIVASSLRWPGIRWDLGHVLFRFEWIGIALALVLFAAVFFDRFDPACRRGSSLIQRRNRRKGKAKAAELTGPAVTRIEPPRAHELIHLTPLSSVPSWGFPEMFAAELKLALKGYSWWWYAVAGGLIVAQCASPLEVSRGPLLTAAWIWPILLWSAMGAREARHGTEQLIFSSPGILPRQLPASWFVGVLIALVTGGGTAARVLLAANYPGIFGWFAGGLFIPSLALALGIWTKSSRPFEGLFTGLWYSGPLNRIPGLDFTGGANGRHTVEYGCVYLALTAALLAIAFFGRGRQLRQSM